MSSILIFLFLSLATAKFKFCNGSFRKGCHESEREALLTFKHDLIDHANQLASWTHLDEDCCGWVGVVCDNGTGHVVELHLGNRQPFLDEYASDAEFEGIEMSNLRGKINPSLLKLRHLHHLDLSNNAFGGIPIPRFLGSIERLRYLNLSCAGFAGLVPHELGNLSSLQYLSLYGDYNNYEDNPYYLYVANLQWLSGLSLLEHLDLGNMNLENASNWFQVLNTLPSLERLYLSQCQLPLVIPPPKNLNLSSLAILDLSLNHFGTPSIGWIFHLNTLVSLDLNHNYLQGNIYQGLQNMTSLRHLDLSCNRLSSSIPEWLYNLKSLQYLNLGSNNLNGEISSAIGNMTSAISLDFSWNFEIKGAIPKSMGNLCNLKSVVFAMVNLSQDVSDVLENFSGCVSKQLDSLDLTFSQLSGQLTDRLRNFKTLKELVLSYNVISGPIPESIGQLSNLEVFVIGENLLDGPIPESIGQLSNLEVFDIATNLLEGVVSEIHFANLTRLKALSASRNTLILKLRHDWIPPFQLEELSLRDWDVGSQLPLWLRSQKQLRYVDISNSTISDIIPSWFWNSIFQFRDLNLSHNQICGEVPNIAKIAYNYSTIDLSFNNLSGPLPYVSSNLSFLDLSNNFLSGSLNPLLCVNFNETMVMKVLRLGKNFLSGEIPDCWMKWQRLKVISLENNNLTGRIPSSMGSLNSLQFLTLRKNDFFGEIPLSLKNCTYLVFLDFGENELHGNITKWLVKGNSLSFLSVLSLHSNNFLGHIPDQLCAFSSLQILDLANNNLSGSLPRCIGNLTAMVEKTPSEGIPSICDDDVYSTCFALFMMMKGQMLEYSTNLNLVRSIDVSNNKLSGEIPVEVTSLSELQSLNLSHNLFTGKIPKRIGVMRSLESLDFSANKLSGSIPQSMSNLTFLNHLNLSCNNLTGEIPSSTQLQSFDPSSYGSNHLCGLPLPQQCSHANGTITPNIGDGGGESDNGFETFWFCLGIPFGFVVGFWSVVWPFLIKRRSCCGI